MAKTNSVYVISSYPGEGEFHGSNTVGVASYTKLLLEAVAEVSKRTNFVVLAETGSGKDEVSESITVVRIWQRGNWGSVGKLWKKIWNDKPREVLVSHEGYMWGNALLGLFALVGIGIVSRLKKTRMIVLMHQVPSGQELTGYWGMGSILVKGYLGIIELLANKIVVMEKILVERFAQGKKVEFVPHMVPIGKSTSMGDARNLLGWDAKKNYALVFGYLAPYKGLDKLIEAWEPGESWELVLAGGINPNHRNNRDTVKYVRKLYLGAKKKNINITGFVPEHEIPLYYSAADVILIPYPAMMSSSGPLALAWGYDKAVQLSAELRGYLVSDDFRQAMRDSGISEEELFFEMNQSGIETMRNHLTKSRLETLKSLALKMQEIRHLKNIGREMAEVLGEIN